MTWIGALFVVDDLYLRFAVDDAYYYLGIASHVWHGDGPTLDGTHPTSGYHLAWMLMLAPLTAAAPSPESAARWMLTAQLLIVLATALWMVRRTRTTALAIGPQTLLALSALLVTPYGFKTLVNGQESALMFAALCAGTAELARLPDVGPTGRNRSALPILALAVGLVAATRWDGAVYSATVVAVLSRHFPRAAALAACTTAVALGAAGAINIAAVGHPFPVSGAIKLYGADLVSARSLSVGLASVIAAAAVLRWTHLRSSGSTRSLAPLLAYTAFLTLYQVGWRARLVPDPWLLVVPVVTVGWIARAICSAPTSRSVRYSIVLVAGLAWIGLLTTWPYRLDPDSWRAQAQAREAGRWVREHLPPDAHLAGWDIGSLAWHSGRSVEPLDGLVHSRSFFKETMCGSGVEAYIASPGGPDYLVQPFWVDAESGAYWGSDGVSVDHPWTVAWGRCSFIRVAHRPGVRSPYAHVVLSRSGTGPALREWIRTASPQTGTSPR